MKTIFLYIILLLSCVATHAQSAQQVEQEINTHLKHIQYWRFEYSPEDTVFKTKVSQQDSIVAANTLLLNYLMKVCNRNAEVLKYDFKLPENSDMKIVTSDDKKLRIYSWDTHTGENEHDNYTVFQYETGSGVKTLSNLNGVPGKAYQKIVFAEPKYYLAIASDMVADNNSEKMVQALFIIQNELRTVDIFKEEGAQQANHITYTYNYSSNYDFRKMKEEYDIRYEKGKLYIPEVEGYKMTGKYRVYNFDGEKFVLDKNAK
jgi:hypothetical protein